MLLLADPPMSLSFHNIASLRITDLTVDGGKTWRNSLFTGRESVAIPRPIIEALRVYLFRHGRKGEPFRDWRPDIGQYCFRTGRIARMCVCAIRPGPPSARALRHESHERHDGAWPRSGGPVAAIYRSQ